MNQILKVETKTIQIVYVSSLGLANPIPIHLARSYHRPPMCRYALASLPARPLMCTTHTTTSHGYTHHPRLTSTPYICNMMLPHYVRPSAFVAWAFVIFYHSIQIHWQSLGTTITFEDGPNTALSP